MSTPKQTAHEANPEHSDRESHTLCMSPPSEVKCPLNLSATHNISIVDSPVNFPLLTSEPHEQAETWVCCNVSTREAPGSSRILLVAVIPYINTCIHIIPYCKHKYLNVTVKHIHFAKGIKVWNPFCCMVGSINIERLSNYLN